MASHVSVSVVVLCATLLLAHGEIFTALVQMERLLHAEHGVAMELKKYVEQERTRLNEIEKIAHDYENHSMQALNDANTYLSNPVNAYLLVKRLTVNLDHVQSMITSTAPDEFNTAISAKSDLLPDERDLQGAGGALLRLMDTYALPTNQIVKGQIKGVQNSPRLNADDSFQLGKIAYMKEDYYHCVLWMHQALQSLAEEETKSVNKVDVLDYLSFALFKQGNVYHALNLTKEWLQIEPSHTRAQENMKYYQQIIEQEFQPKSPKAEDYVNEKPTNEYLGSTIYRDYEKLCRGEETHKVKDAHKLTCRLRRDHPYFYIRPLKEETVNFKPHIRFVYDILTDSEIAKVKELAEPKLHRSGVFVWEGGNKDLVQDYRTSKSAWLGDDEDKLIRRISQKAGAVSGLSISTAEEMQVLNYGIGGHYEPHHDFARAHETGIFQDLVGNRIATVLFYMTDVEAGGATVFPQLGVKVNPVKGSCVFWYNLLENGEGDYATQHAACPVLTGTKWVCNKWFHERGQEFKRPCNVDPNV